MTEAQERFERILRDQARAADVSASLPAWMTAHHDVHPLAGRELRKLADNFTTRMKPDDLRALEQMSDHNMELLAMVLGEKLAREEVGA